jgi:hypothetical protein
MLSGFFVYPGGVTFCLIFLPGVLPVRLCHCFSYPYGPLDVLYCPGGSGLERPHPLYGGGVRFCALAH